MTEKAAFAPPRPLDTAVLLLVFQRLETTKEVLQAIRQAKPPRLYLACDGPRSGDEAQRERVASVRRHVTGAVDWPCEVQTMFQDENLGCKGAVSAAISWFFAHEEMGIILEDDCLPALSFFWFCEDLLHRYREDHRVMQICGFNHFGKTEIKESYYFSKFGAIWGWASWRRAWDCYDPDIALWPRVRDLGQAWFFCDTESERRWLQEIFEKVHAGRIDSWAYRWLFALLVNRGLSVLPRESLVENIGFGSLATHTRSNTAAYGTFRETEYPLQHPFCLLRNKELDARFVAKYAPGSFVVARYRWFIGKCRGALSKIVARGSDKN